MSEEKIIQTLGSYRKTIYRNDYTGYCIFQIVAADESKLKSQDKRLTGVLTCIGNIPEYRLDTPLYLEGTVEKTKFGYQLRVIKIEERSWDANGLAAYLCNICTGLGITTANALAEAFETTLFDVIKQENAAEILSGRISSLSYETAVLLCDTIGATSAQLAVYEEIFPLGGTWSAASKIAKKYGVNAVKELHANPYLAGMKNGMDFHACDKLAKKVGMSATDQARIKQALITSFETEQSRGHVYSTEGEICKQAHRLIRKSAYAETDIPSVMLIQGLIDDDTFVFDYDKEGMEAIYLKWLYRAEEETARQLQRLMRSSQPLEFDPDIADWAEANCGIKYAPQQRESFKLIEKTGVAVITGGPGTGKTTTVNGLIAAYEKLNPNKVIRLCAPTGRAAQRMTESTGREAVTIHRLLEFRPFGNDTVHKNAADPIIADLIVVDEASMLDIELASIFLSAVQSGTLVLFIGDINQLPSVGPGDVLHDLIDSECIPTVQLSTVYRQGSQSPIIVNSKRINEGLNCAVTDDDYHMDVLEDASTILLRTIQLVASMYDPQKPFDVQVLAPTHKGDAGVGMINTMLQDVLNPPNGQPEMKYGSRIYRVGDKVILLNNNYSVGYFNGDIGTVKDITSEGIEIEILDKTLKLTKSEMEDLNLAYCMSIHKSQGSEFPNVIVVLPEKPGNMLKRNLLYTAITRAKKRVWVLAEGNAYITAVASCDTGKRNTRLAQRIQRYFNEK